MNRNINIPVLKEDMFVISEELETLFLSMYKTDIPVFYFAAGCIRLNLPPAPNKGSTFAKVL